MGGSGLRGPADSRVGHDTVNGGQFDELRNLLLGPEWKQLIELKERIRNRSLRAVDVAEVLPEAILVLARRDPQLRRALQPILHEAFLFSIRIDPRGMAEALLPVIGPAIRGAVAAAIQNMVESLNQIVETSLSARSIQWRIEAAKTGKSYGEIALLRSLLYRVEQVFLIQRKTGLLLQHVTADSVVVQDPDMVSGMLTAIQDFVRDSFGSGDDALETVRVGQISVWILHGPEAILAGAVRGAPPAQLRATFSSALDTIQQEFGRQITSFDGDAAPLAPARTTLQTCLLGQCPRKPRTSWLAYLAISLLLLLFAGWLIVSWREWSRWDSYLSALSLEPGIVITQREKNGSRYTIAGLRDPLARDPVKLLQQRDLPAEKATFHWEPYLSLSPGLAARREVMELKNVIEQQIIRFDSGRSEPGERDLELVESFAGTIRKMHQASTVTGAELRLEVIGHTDELGSKETNTRLAWDRANTVKSILTAQGIQADLISTRSAGATEPLRSGQTEHDRALNRSVSFRVLTQLQ